MKPMFKSLAVASVAAVALSLPMAASANTYKKCEDTGTSIAGGLVGGTLGAVLGEEIAGRGNNTEGAVAGALVGGILGAAVGDSVSDCEKYDRDFRQRDRVIYPSHDAGYRNVHHRNRGHAYNHRGRRGYDRGYNRGYDRGYNRGYQPAYHYGYSRQSHTQDLRRIDYRMDELRRERSDLKYRAQFERGRWINRRLRDISQELEWLKDERRRLKRAFDHSRRR